MLQKSGQECSSSMAFTMRIESDDEEDREVPHLL